MCDVLVQAVKINEFVGLKFCEKAVTGNSSEVAVENSCSMNPAGLT